MQLQKVGGSEVKFAKKWYFIMFFIFFFYFKFEIIIVSSLWGYLIIDSCVEKLQTTSSSLFSRVLLSELQFIVIIGSAISEDTRTSFHRIMGE